jgi:hypothetical protein
VGSNDKVYLVAHTATKETSDIAQATIVAANDSAMRREFASRYPERTIQNIGIKGREG